MRIAVFHSFLDNIGGAEMVALTLSRELKADLYTTNIDRLKVKKMGFEDVAVKSIGRVPIHSPFRQQLTLAKFRSIDLANDYDFFIIAGDWAVSAAVNNRPNLWYVHSMMKEIWDLAPITKKNNVPWLLKPAFDFWAGFNRGLVAKYVKSVDKVVVNSAVTKKRVSYFIGRDATIIYPPVAVEKYHHSPSENFWLSVNRLIDHKKVEIQLEAFSKLPNERLIIVGSYERANHFTRYVKRLKKLKPKNVEFLSWVDQAELIDLYAKCKGFITTSDNEDFGLTAVEAMASGKPVIAPNQGGYCESVVGGKCGILIDNISSDSLAAAIKQVNGKISSYQSECLNQAKKFDVGSFSLQIKREIGGGS